MPLLDIADPAKPEKSLTPAKIAKQIKPPKKGSKSVYWVHGLGVPNGFGLLVRPPTTRWKINATWIMQADDPSGTSRRVNISRYGQITFDDAMAEAKQLRDQIQAGENPNAAKRRKRDETMAHERVLAFTLGDAVELYVNHLRRHGSQKRRRPGRGELRIIETYRSELKPLSDLMNRPLAELKKAEMAERHEHITDQNGPRAANKAMKNLRAAWNYARSRHEELPHNILKGDKNDRGFAYNSENFGGDSITWRDLPNWWAKVHSIANPVRRDLQLFALFTGMRCGDCTTLRWDDVDLDAGTVHRPNPKGGKAKAFSVPVSTFVLELLQRRKEQNRTLYNNDDSGWVFPTSRVRGEEVTHVSEMKEQRYVTDPETEKRVKRRWLPSPHELRRTFGSACVAAGISEHHKHILMNHSQRQANVGDRYSNADFDDLRVAIEDVAAFLLEKAGSEQLDAG